MANRRNIYQDLEEDVIEKDPQFPEEFGAERTAVVQLDGLALLKIIKHAKDNVPDLVNGQLVGLDVEDRLEITNCFAYPSVDEDTDAYQEAMLKCMREARVDHNIVGWYQSALMSSFYTKDMVETQYEHQKAFPNAVVIVYDPFRTTMGRLALKAFRLTRDFMEAYGQQKKIDERRLNAAMGEILEEVPIKVHNSHLVHGFLYEVREAKTMSCDFDRLTLSATPFIEKNMDVLSRIVEDFNQEQAKHQYHQRQLQRQKSQQAAAMSKFRADNEARIAAGKEPYPEEALYNQAIFKNVSRFSRLDLSLIGKQLEHHCDNVNGLATQALSKMYAMEAVNKQTA